MSAGPSFTRREGLTALGLLGPVGLLAACTSDAAPDEPLPSASPLSIAAATASAELELVALYAAVAAAFPDLAASLAPIGAQHQSHADAVAGGGTSEPSASPTPIAVPGTRSQALDLLVASERRAMRERIDACVAADEPGLARTLAFLGASEASHIPALRDLRS